MKKTTLMSLLIVSLVALLAVGGTLAWFTAETDPVEGKFTTGTVEVTIEETEAFISQDFSNINPGDEFGDGEAFINVIYTGSLDAKVRAKIEVTWDDNLPTGNVELGIDDGNWDYNEDDGWYYYKGVVGGVSEEEEEVLPLLDSIKIDGEGTDHRYQGKTLTIKAEAQAIQAANAAPWPALD